MPSFSDRLRLLRKQRGLTQEQIGKIVNKSKNNISQYERNIRQADDETKKQLAIYFDVSMDYLIGITENPTPISKFDNNKDIDKEFDNLIKKLQEQEELNFQGREIDDQTRTIIIKTLQHAKELAESTASYNCNNKG
ncbi:MAG: helix-turn-helix domain-containing protein [Vallitalea sp.]|jgi:transcriptional regulator with XRE-family HTH domain|nr:helix-turn-helix domain-containing protein [Vallitalea sp.]